MTESNNEPLFQIKSVGGWLLLLCLALTVFSPLRTLITYVISSEDNLRLFDLYPGWKVVFYIDASLSVLLMIMSIRAGLALWTIKPKAVQIAKNYLLLYLGYSIIASILPFFAGLPSSSNNLIVQEMAKGFFQSLIFFIVWYKYLSVSKRVKATYGSDLISEESNNVIL